jgi:hypothetical protein
MLNVSISIIVVLIAAAVILSAAALGPELWRYLRIRRM